jgi:hypothetical protein
VKALAVLRGALAFPRGSRMVVMRWDTVSIESLERRRSFGVSSDCGDICVVFFDDFRGGADGTEDSHFIDCDAMCYFNSPQNANIFVLVFVVSFMDRTRSELQHTYSSFLFFIPVLHSCHLHAACRVRQSPSPEPKFPQLVTVHTWSFVPSLIPFYVYPFLPSSLSYPPSLW